MLEKLREKFAETFEKLGDFLHDHKDVADLAINQISSTYQDLKGHEKMEMAVAFFLEQVHIPAPIAIYSSHKIVETVEKFLQERYDISKQAEKA